MNQSVQYLGIPATLHFPSNSVYVVCLTHHLEEGEVGMAHMVEGDLGVDPGVVLSRALPLVVHHRGQQALTIPVGHYHENVL